MPTRFFIALMVLVSIPLLIGQGCASSQKRSTTDGGVFLSTDRGQSWTQSVLVRREEERTITIADVSILSMIPHAADRRVLYLATRESGIYRTNDRGQTWSQIGPSSSGNFPTVSVHPKDDALLFTVSGNAIYRTRNGGKDWERVYVDARKQALVDVDIDVFSPQKVFATTAGGELLLSSDGGDTWTVHTRLNVQLKSLHISPSDSRTQYLVAQNSIFKTTNQWATSTDLRKQSLKPYAKNGVKDFVMLRGRPNVLIVTNTAGILRSTDSGESWELLPTLFPKGKFPSSVVAVNPQSLDEIYVVIHPKTIHHTRDAGKNWKTLQGFPGSRMITDLFVDFNEPEKLYAATLRPAED